MHQLLVSDIRIYPVKSLGGISLSHARVLSRGLAYDRRWMLVDDQNLFMTQRDYPGLALFKTSFGSNGILIRYADSSIEIPFTVHGQTTIPARVWNDDVEVMEPDTAYSRWFSQILSKPCKLVWFPDHHRRAVDPFYALHNDQVSLADGFPFLLTGQSSLDELNRQLKEPIPMNRFRPNIVFRGGLAFQEDQWHYFQIGECRFAAVKPCARCVTITVDQETGIKGMEPLRTLSAFRMKNNKVYFGQNLLVLNEGEISVGQEIIIEKDNFY
ncbi:MAG TPA: MOSC N-terminal beta barrel domain-containing protein [Chitinophagaceae bacterium]|nr:MOSC N-terminal beta barrel domain-containing protein [Chitinophagaceae bacterium]